MNDIRVDVKITENVSDSAVQKLINELKKIKGFMFYVDSQFTISSGN